MAKWRKGWAAATLCCCDFCAAQKNSPEQTGFSRPRENESFSTAMEDFKRYAAKKQWDAAFKAISKATDTPLKGFAADDNGIWLPSRQRIAALLLSLPPEGLATDRLFYNAGGKQALADAISAGAKDLAPLQKAIDQYFLTASGPALADRLGDTVFEAGDFGAALLHWRMIADHFPGSSVSQRRLLAKNRDGRGAAWALGQGRSDRKSRGGHAGATPSRSAANCNHRRSTSLRSANPPPPPLPHSPRTTPWSACPRRTPRRGRAYSWTRPPPRNSMTRSRRPAGGAS